MNLRKSARGRDCMIRIPGVCNHDSNSVVLCHYRMSGLSGMGIKPADLFGAFGCSACHAYVDTHHDAETQLAFAHGVFRTQQWWLKQELVAA